MREFLASYLRDHIHLVAITPDGPVEGRYFGADIDGATQWATAQNTAGRNLYWTTNITTPGLNRKPKKTDIIGIRCAHVDIDPSPGWNKQVALNDLVARGAPSVVIDSGNGLQGLWWMNTATDAETIERTNRGLMAAFAGGDHCWNVDRLLRLPGSINYPDAKKRAAGRVETRSALVVPFTGRAFSPAEISAVFPPPADPTVAAPVNLTSGPVPEYTGPADDDVLIERMLASGGSIGAQFGTKASARDLWNGDAANLCQLFPSDKGDSFDRSKADLALMSHLAFWTGKDAARMDRLFRRSALVRLKYLERSQGYADVTIGKAIAACNKVYDVVRADPVDAPASELVAGEFLTIGEQIDWFKGCVYVRDKHAVLIPGGQLLKPEVFNVMYGGKRFVMSPDGSKPTDKAFEAFTVNRAYRFPRAATTTFKPRETPGAIIGDAVNTYWPDDIDARPGDVTPFLNHVAKLLPNETDRQIFLTYCASMVQNIGIKFQWAPVLQGCEGNGTSWLAKCMMNAIGRRYYHKPNAGDISNKFNDFMIEKLMIDVQEIQLEDRYEVIENLKDWITDDWIEVQPKGGKKSMVDNVANWFLVTNHKNAIPVSKNGRRFAMLFTAQQFAEDLVRDGMDGKYFPDLWNWSRAGGFAHVAHFLRTMPLVAEYDPAGSCHRAPTTTSTVEAIRASQGRAEQEIHEAIEVGDRGFRNGWVSMAVVEKLMLERGVRISRQKIAVMLEQMGFRSVGRASKMIPEEDGKRPVLWVIRAHWKPELNVDDYAIAQGYATQTRPVVVPMPGMMTG